MCKLNVSKILMLLGAVVLAAVPLSAQWHSDTRISDTPSSSYTPYYYSGGWGVAADANDVYVVWRESTVRAVVFPIGSPPATPGSGTALSTSSVSYDVAVAAGDGTNAHAVWDYSSHQYYNGYNGSSWGSQYEHYYTGDNMRAQSIANNAAGTSFIATSGTWSNPAFVYRVRYRERSAAGVWGPMIDAWAPSSTDYHYFVAPSICLTPNGTRHISMGVYRTAGPSYTVGHMWSTDGTTWSSEYVLPANSAYHVQPTSICSDPDGNIYIAYMNYPSPYQVAVVDNVGGSWNTPVQISNCPSTLYYLSICCDTAGTAWVAWEDRSGQNYEIYYATRPKGGSWSAPQELTSNDGILSRYPNITADPNGNVHITWTDQRDGNYEVYYNWYGASGGGPGPGERDLACTRVIAPVGKISKEPITPEAVVANLADAEDSCYAICTITGPGSSYEKGNTEGIVYLDAGQEKALEFPSWTPPGSPGDKYQISVTVYLWPEKTIEDANPDNNTDADYCTIGSAIQVDPVEVALPQEGLTYDRFIPKATFKNTGSETATDFYCYCEIFSEVGLMTAPYIDSFAVASLEPEATVDVTFPNQWTCDDSQLYQALFYAAVPATPERDLLGIELPVNFQGTPFTGIGEEDGPVVLKVTGSNPASGGVHISYALKEPGDVNVSIYDVSGKRVRVLYEGLLSGSGTLTWDTADDSGRHLNAGLFFVRMTTSNSTKTAKVVLTR